MTIDELLTQALESPTGLSVGSPNRIALRTFLLRAIGQNPAYAGLTCIFSPISGTDLIVAKAELLEKHEG